VLAPLQRVRLGPAQLLGRVDVRADGRELRMRLSGRAHRQVLRRRRAAVRREVPGQTFVPVRGRGGGAEHAAVQRRAGDQAVGRARGRLLRQAPRRARQVPVLVVVRRRAGAEDFRPRYSCHDRKILFSYFQGIVEFRKISS